MTIADLPASLIITQDAGTRRITFDVDVKTIAESNANEFWRKRHARAKKQKLAVLRAMTGLLVPRLPVVVTFTRRSPATMDCDNLPSSQKHLRDQISKLYGVGDSPNDPIVWKYTQEKCKRGTFGVRVLIESGVADAS